MYSRFFVFIQTFRPQGIHQCFILSNLLHDDTSTICCKLCHKAFINKIRFNAAFFIHKHLVSFLCCIFLFCLCLLCVSLSCSQCCLCLVSNVVCVLCPMLSVSCAQCCLCLVSNVVCVLCPMLSVSCVQC
jgi:hypothetical protein